MAHRNFGIDALRVVLALMVVGLHAGAFREAHPFESHMLVNGLFRVAVPGFFAINGYYIFEAFESSHRFADWLKKIAALYAFWMLVYLPLYFPHKGLSVDAVMNFAAQLLFGYQHLWYVAALGCAGASLYLVRHASALSLLGIAGALFMLGVLAQYLVYYNDLLIPYWAYRNFLFFGFPIVTVVFVMRRGKIMVRPTVITRALLLLGLCGLALESFLASRVSIPRGFDLYLSLMLVAPLLLVEARAIKWPINVKEHLSKLSSALYFMHPILIMFSALALGMQTSTHRFMMAVALCLVIYYPLHIASRRFRFIL